MLKRIMGTFYAFATLINRVASSYVGLGVKLFTTDYALYWFDCEASMMRYSLSLSEITPRKFK